MNNNLKEKIEAAEHRIKELQLLIEHWKKQKLLLNKNNVTKLSQDFITYSGVLQQFQLY